MGSIIYSKLLLTCLFCKKQFTSNKNCKNRTVKYCSMKCYKSIPISDVTKKRQSAAKIGKPPHNKGKKAPAGYVHPRPCLGRKFPHRSGANSHFWKGGVTNKNEADRKSVEYKNWRVLVFTRDCFKCVMCGSNKKIQADHIKPFSLFIELRFDVNNGRTLCYDCHLKTETYGGKMLKYER